MLVIRTGQVRPANENTLNQSSIYLICKNLDITSLMLLVSFVVMVNNLSICLDHLFEFLDELLNRFVICREGEFKRLG